MIYYFSIIIVLLILLSLAIASYSFAPWVPAWKKDLPRIFELADLKPGEIYYDLGCGDGKTVVYAHKNYQAQAIGLEIALPLYFVCSLKKIFHRDKNLVFKYKNLFTEDLSQADVVYFFGMPKHLKDKLRLKLERELKPGARIISYVFPVPDWQPVKVSKPKNDDISIYLYKV